MFKVNFIVEFSKSGKIEYVIRTCKIPNECEECKFNNWCDKVEKNIKEVK